MSVHSAADVAGHARPVQAGEVDGEGRDTAGALHEHRFARSHRPEIHERAPGRERGTGQRRRFRIVEWAAMDFLIEAEKRNRRRVRLEQLILLLLRCLAILLIALLVARPFSQSQGLASLLMADASFERVIVLDDSPSMQLQAEGKVTFDETKKGLVAFLRDLSRERSRDTDTGVFVAEENGRLIGLAIASLRSQNSFFEPSRYGYISDLLVLESERRRGIGTILFRRIIKWFRGQGITVARLHVASCNEAARSFWSSVGAARDCRPG